MNLRFIDWIWNVRGSVALPPGQSNGDVFTRLSPLFGQPGSSHETAGDTLTFHKKDQAAQDRMAIFDSGVLRVERDAAGPILRYRLVSRTLLFCFLLPLLFLSFAGLTIALNYVQSPSAADAAAKAKKAAAKKKPDIPLNPIDKALGAPEPEKKKDKDKDKDKDEQPTPTSAYVFAGIFAALYPIGRILESRQVNTLFRKAMLGA